MSRIQPRAIYFGGGLTSSPNDMGVSGFIPRIIEQVVAQLLPEVGHGRPRSNAHWTLCKKIGDAVYESKGRMSHHLDSRVIVVVGKVFEEKKLERN